LGYSYWDDGTDSLANRCLLYRIKYGLTMGELAEIIGISCRTIERIENEEDSISFKMKKIVSKVFNDIDQLGQYFLVGLMALSCTLSLITKSESLIL